MQNLIAQWNVKLDESNGLLQLTFPRNWKGSIRDLILHDDNFVDQFMTQHCAS